MNSAQSNLPPVDVPLDTQAEAHRAFAGLAERLMREGKFRVHSVSFDWATAFTLEDPQTAVLVATRIDSTMENAS